MGERLVPSIVPPCWTRYSFLGLSLSGVLRMTLDARFQGIVLGSCRNQREKDDQQGLHEAPAARVGFRSRVADQMAGSGVLEQLF
jgi:hypothetical protein